MANSDPRCNDVEKLFGDPNAANGSFNEQFIDMNVSLLIPFSSFNIYATQLSLTVIGFTHSIVTFCIFLYMYFTKSPHPNVYLRIKKRNIYFYTLSSAATFFMTYGGQFSALIWIPCWITALINSLLAPSVGLYIMGKTLDFFTRSAFYRMINDARVDDDVTHTTRKAVGEVRTLLLKQNSAKAMDSDGDRETADLQQSVNSMSKDTIQMAKFILSPNIRFILMDIISVPYLIYVIVDFSQTPYLNPSANCYGCNLAIDQLNTALIYSSIAVIIGLIIAFISRKFPDNFGILREMRYFCLAGILVIAGVGSAFFTNYDEGRRVGLFGLYWFGAQMMIFATSTLQIYLALVEETSEFKLSRGSYFSNICKRRKRGREYQVTSPSAMTSAKVQKKAEAVDKLKELLNNGQGTVEYKKFEEYLGGEFATENIRMYEECLGWKAKFFDLNSATRRSRAKRIVTLYIKTDSVFYVNLPATMREKIESLVLKQTEKELDLELFDEAQKEMFNILEGAYLRFLRKRKN